MQSNPHALTPMAADGSVSASGPLARLARLPAAAKWRLGIGLLVLIAVVTGLVQWSRQAEWRVVFANLADKDAGAVVAQLSQMNVPYRHAEAGNAILVPADKVHDVRLKLAQAGLPKGSVVGFELMDGARFGQTQFQERLTFQRGLEGELVRSIGSLAAVLSARVHLALPQQNGFFREQQTPRASVLITLHPGRQLDRAQIAGIVHLVSSSVPELNPRAVSVIDQNGALLSGQHDEFGAGLGAETEQRNHVQQIEAMYLKRLIDILEPAVGRDNLRATVTADLDFAQSEATSEAYKPNQTKDAAAIRSIQSSESSGSDAAAPSGVPGAASNQPPTAATAPLTGASAPLQAATAGAGSGSLRRDSVTNYEVDKTVRVTRQATGTIRRLHAAVVINHAVKVDDKGATTSEPLSAEALEKLTALAQQAIGFDSQRGDSVKVINVPFKAEPVVKPEPVPLWKQDWVLDLLRSGAPPAALTIVALAVVFGVLRPALKASPAAAAGTSPQGSLDVVANEPVALPAAGRPAVEVVQDDRLVTARQVAKDNPAAVANIVRAWTKGEPA